MSKVFPELYAEQPSCWRSVATKHLRVGRGVIPFPVFPLSVYGEGELKGVRSVLIFKF